ncbi:MAG: hypothetical protein HUU28_15380 [Planctomycetaceae bacterium]|nr:hypothetical protein [Planctomycetaceae bacterium]
MSPADEGDAFNPYRAPREGSGEDEPIPEGRAPRAVAARLVEIRPWLVTLAVGAWLLVAAEALFGLLLLVAAIGLLDESSGEAAAAGLLAILMLLLAVPAAICAFSAGRAASSLQRLESSPLWPDVFEGLHRQRNAWRALALGLGASLVLSVLVFVTLVVIGTQFSD